MTTANPQVIATAELDLLGTQSLVQARVFKPEWDQERAAWSCRFEVESPISIGQTVFGETGLQALCLALKLMSSALYSSNLYKAGQLGAFGEFGGYLGVPAPKEALDHAPFPF